MTPIFFSKQSDFREWLENNHNKEIEVLIGFFKVNTGKPSLSWSESVDVALCYGWIDGVRKSIDKDSYQIRFTKRKPTSIWSAKNIKKIEVLSKQGLMKPSGLASFKNRKESKSKIYSYENEAIKLSATFEQLFKANKKAWEYFQSLASSYKKASTNWVMNAKQETTRTKRLEQLIRDSEAATNQWKDNKYNKKL